MADEEAVTKTRVRCRSAALGYERFAGTLGDLESCQLPFLGYLFWPVEGGGQISIRDLSGWEFREAADLDPLIQAASHWPQENVTQASAVGPAVEPTPEHRRAREVYDANHFVMDVDLAINYVRSVFTDLIGDVARVQPRVVAGTAMRSAIFEVCLALIVRQLPQTTLLEHLDMVLPRARQMLIDKNAAYGNSALDPVRVFSQASLKEQLLVRLDDKVSRLARGQAAGEDVAGDMLGYLLLVAIAEKRERE